MQSSSKYDVSKYVTGSYKNLIHTDYVSTNNGEAIYELSLKRNCMEDIISEYQILYQNIHQEKYFIFLIKKLLEYSSSKAQKKLKC